MRFLKSSILVLAAIALAYLLGAQIVRCSDDMAGYRWAEANAVADPDDCTGKTGSFIEGCRVYALQQAR
jgi:hypothetical protein